MTKLVRFSPTVDSRTFQNEFDRLFDTFFPTLQTDNGSVSWAPRIDFIEREDSYEIRMDAPGMEKSDISLDFHDGALTVSGERRMPERLENDVHLRSERRWGSFSRTFALPRTIVDKNIAATYEDGVLTVSIPKSEESKPRRIQIS
ncbi:MAG: Hsp20/alpha crystallin family protein [Rhodothermales bacterium]|nr:Hsp20/alpha crystallin family protein [Rhodothermales bacterium]MBO6780892.1 Hsp20/alpha crystallin family protein [Rhodothermales bacterium]